jgi:hypothetical protein
MGDQEFTFFGPTRPA